MKNVLLVVVFLPVTFCYGSSLRELNSSIAGVQETVKKNRVCFLLSEEVDSSNHLVESKRKHVEVENNVKQVLDDVDSKKFKSEEDRQKMIADTQKQIIEQDRECSVRLALFIGTTTNGTECKENLEKYLASCAHRDRLHCALQVLEQEK